MRDERPHASTNQPATIPALASEALMEKGVNDFCRAARVAGETMESAMRELQVILIAKSLISTEKFGYALPTLNAKNALSKVAPVTY